jgi:hypothetical protein
VRWLHKNYPPPTDRYVEVTLDVNHAPGLIFECTMADDYETCMHELAKELALNAGACPKSSGPF